MAEMQITLFGCKDTTLHVARHLLRQGRSVRLVTLLPDKGKEQDVAGYLDFRDHAHLFTDIYHAQRYDLTGTADKIHFAKNSFELGICIGWQRLIPLDVLTQFTTGVFGMHGSSRDLPFGRGRSPMNWSILEGRQWFFTNLFKYEPGIDDGPVLDTDCFSITSDDTAETLHYKNSLSLIRLLETNFKYLVAGNFILKPQRDAAPTYYPKRNWEDGAIDWDDLVFNTQRKIRAVAAPFFGAFSYLNGELVKFHRCGVFYTDIESHVFRNAPNGFVCDVMPSGKFLVRCSGGVLIVHEHDGATKPIAAGQMFETTPEMLKVFPRNTHGFFDF